MVLYVLKSLKHSKNQVFTIDIFYVTLQKAFYQSQIM